MPGNWRRGASEVDLEARLRADTSKAIKAVVVVHNETSTGVTSRLHDVRGTMNAAAHPALLIVDGISGLGADRLETDAWGVDLAIAASQKALMLPPGLAFLSVSKKAAARMATSNLPKFYVDLKLYEEGIKDWDTPFTPALTLVRALEKALDLIEAEGIENVFKRCAALGEFTRRRLQGLGLGLFSKSPSSALSAVGLPAGIARGR